MSLLERVEPVQCASGADVEFADRHVDVVVGNSNKYPVLMCVEHKMFGLELSYLLCRSFERDEEYLLNEILESGNFSFKDNKRKK